MNRDFISRSVERRITLVLFGILVFVVISLSTLHHHRKRIVFRHLNGIAGILKDNLEQIEPDSTMIDLTQYRSGNYRISIIDRHGDVIADTHPESSDIPYLYKRPEIVRGLSGYPDIRMRKNSGKYEYYYVAPLKFSDPDMTRLKTLLYLQFLDTDTIVRPYLPVILGFSGLLLAITLGVFFYQAYREKVAMEHVVRSIQELVKGHGLPDGAKDLGNFRDIMDEIEVLGQRVLHDNSELQYLKGIQDTLFNSLKAKICVVDASGRILYRSRKFNQMFSNRDITGRKLREVIRDDTFNHLIEKTFAEKSNQEMEIAWNREYYAASSSWISEENCVVILLYNITEIRHTQTMQSEFIQNVSHELKTPLTSIKGFLETLREDIEDEDSLGYISIIERNTNRLIRIIQDLFVLTRNESDAVSKFKPLNLGKLIRQIGTGLQDEIDGKGLELTIDIDDCDFTVQGDMFKLEQVFINLIRNSMQHTEKGMIHLGCIRKNNSVEAIVQDTGIGIPGKHLPFLFDRFYVVDKSRSRKYGGTGLGLSIVKQIVSQHSGEIGIESSVGKGTTVTIHFPAMNKNNHV